MRDEGGGMNKEQKPEARSQNKKWFQPFILASGF
jgi:hypothetical protein